MSFPIFARRFARSAVPSAAVAILSFAASASAAGLMAGAPCPTCELAARMQLQQQLGAPAPTASSLGINVASVASHLTYGARPGTTVPFAAPEQAQRRAQAQAQLYGPSWADASGDPVGSFQRPWSFGSTNLDPSFRTSYWSDETGPINDPSAPWNQFVPQPYASMYFNYGRAMALGFGTATPFGPSRLVWAPSVTGPLAPPQPVAGAATLNPTPRI